MDTDTPDGFEYPDIDEEQFEIGSQHDAEMIAQHTRHGALIKWSWTDGRRTVTPTEHDEINWATEEAEDRHPPEELESGTVVAKVWMDDDETIDEMEWQDA